MKKCLKVVEILLGILSICVILWSVCSYLDVILHNNLTSVDTVKYAPWNLFVLFI